MVAASSAGPRMMLLPPRKRATNSERGVLVDLLRRAELLDAAGVHDGDQVGRGHGLALVVGDVDRRVAVGVVQAADLEAHLLAQVGVEVRQRLVQQQGLGLHDQRAGERDALLLAARQLGGIALGQRRQLRGLQDGVDLGRDGRAVELAQRQAVGDVLRPPSCAATARSSGTPSTRCAARAAACAPARRRRGRRARSRPRSAR